MIYAYGITLKGTAHEKNGIVCQDSHEILPHDKKGKEMVIAAVADGLGSEKYSDVASAIAVKVSTEYCRKNIFPSSKQEKIIDVIRISFSEAQRAIEKEVDKNNHDLDQYDTTLSLAVLIEDTLYFGHSGDSGIIALTTEGLFEKVTEQNRDDNNCVYPLFFEDKWEFGHFEKKVCSVFLATDGIYELLFPHLIKNVPVNTHIKLAQFFMDNEKLKINDEKSRGKTELHIKEYLENIPDKIVNDDKTVVVLVNTSIKAKRQPDEYYKEPDWKELKLKHDEEYKRKAYPHLFKDKTADVTLEEYQTNNAQKAIEVYGQFFSSANDIKKYYKPQIKNKISILAAAVVLATFIGILLGIGKSKADERFSRSNNDFNLTINHPVNDPYHLPSGLTRQGFAEKFVHSNALVVYSSQTGNVDRKYILPQDAKVSILNNDHFNNLVKIGYEEIECFVNQMHLRDFRITEIIVVNEGINADYYLRSGETRNSRYILNLGIQARFETLNNYHADTLFRLKIYQPNGDLLQSSYVSSSGYTCDRIINLYGNGMYNLGTYRISSGTSSYPSQLRIEIWYENPYSPSNTNMLIASRILSIE